MNISQWSQNIHEECIRYLNKYAESSMFLLQNINEFGPKKGKHHNSGNFYVITSNGVVKGVFVLANRGNILFQLDEDVDSLEVIEYLLNNEDIQIKGVLGENSRAKEMWEIILQRVNGLKESFKSCEILYSLTLKDCEFPETTTARLFLESDLDKYLDFTKNFYNELELSNNLTDEQLKEIFYGQVNDKIIWCLEENNELVSMCSLNARYKNLAQIGGVYTPSIHRSKGYSKKCMKKLIYDCVHLHGIDKIILFTGSENYPAQKVYERLGFQRIGFYGMYFGVLR